MSQDTDNPETGERGSELGFDPACAFQEASDWATRFARLGLEAAATPLAWLPDETRGQLRQSAGEALRGLAVGPRVLSGALEELAREVEVPLEDSDLGSRRRDEADSGPGEPPVGPGRESG